MYHTRSKKKNGKEKSRELDSGTRRSEAFQVIGLGQALLWSLSIQKKEMMNKSSY